MTIEKGKEWGVPFTTSSDIVFATNDYHLAQMSPNTKCSVTSGDLWLSLGQPAQRSNGENATLVHIDAMEITVTNGQKDSILLAASSVEVGKWSSFLNPHRRYIVITNCGILRGRNLTPRAHPNDGFVDTLVLNESMSIMQRLIALRRSVSGTHIPHPHINISRTADVTFAREKHESLTIDGRQISDWSEVRVRVVPDYWQVVI